MMGMEKERRMDRLLGLMEELVRQQEEAGDFLMSAKEAASRMGTSPGNIYQFVKAGMLPALRFGKDIRIRENALCAFLRAYEGKDVLAELARQQKAGA